MKKRMAWIPSGLLAASLIFSGCANMNTDNPFLTEASESLESSASETSESSTVQESSETVSSSQEETTKITQSSMATTSSDLHLDKAWLNAVTDLYHKTHPNNDRYADIYVDGLRGEGGYMPQFNNMFSFEYIASNGSQSFTLNIDPETEKAPARSRKISSFCLALFPLSLLVSQTKFTYGNHSILPAYS